ncbi:hypothetical protein QTO34_018617 [Cnephaeus nilssonii]|uniref:Uncharacterized protein n=1 Tax=Cnephaeus nilssonii TaxID=3371016 RepID=A0AA40HZ52_CNENI|nr:hypothetical protein QTO34_018617 [Eptesicus nilssonii]
MKSLARCLDDKDVDQMLREQEREGDLTANFIKRNNAKENNNKKGWRYRPRGSEQKRFARLASRKAMERLAHKWSVEVCGNFSEAWEWLRVVVVDIGQPAVQL